MVIFRSALVLPCNLGMESSNGNMLALSTQKISTKSSKLVPEQPDCQLAINPYMQHASPENGDSLWFQKIIIKNKIP